MASSKSSFLDKVLGRIGRLDPEGLQTVVERLARERSFLETLFNVIEDGVLVLDEQGRILYFNQSVVRLIGLPDERAEGQPLQRYLPQLDWDQLSDFDARGGRRVTTHEFEIDYPEPRFLRVYASPLDGDKIGSTGLALVLHDATEARQQTFEAIESERIQALTLLAASVAHEIGNPLNALHIHLQLMERELRKLRRLGSATPQPADEASGPELELERLEKFLGVCKGEVTRLDYIVTQFLQAIRPTRPRLEAASLNDAVNETLDLLRPEIANRGLRLQLKLKRPLPLVQLDVPQIKQAIVNLVKNAMQAMTGGGTLVLQTSASSEGVCVIVGDTGGGIPQEKLNRIFEPYFTTKEKGSGLGLMIVQRIVREHSGRIEIESHVGEGTSFRLWFPLPDRLPRLLGHTPETVKEAPARGRGRSRVNRSKN